jgi:hypothetical protein
MPEVFDAPCSPSTTYTLTTGEALRVIGSNSFYDYDSYTLNLPAGTWEFRMLDECGQLMEGWMSLKSPSDIMRTIFCHNVRTLFNTTM